MKVTRETAYIGLKATAYWGIRLPIAITLLLEFLLKRALRTSGHQVCLGIATGFAGVLGLALYRRPARTWWTRIPGFLLAWALTLVGLILLVARGWIPGLIVTIPLVLTRFIVSVFTEPERNPWWPKLCPLWALWAVGIVAYILISEQALVLLKAIAPYALILAILGPPLAAWLGRRASCPGSETLCLNLATGGMGIPGLRLVSSPFRRGWVRWPARCLGWVLCAGASAAFLIFGWVLTPFLPFWLLCLPVALTQALAKVYAAAAGPDWHRAGFRLATCFQGSAGLYLFEMPVRRWWMRWPMRSLAWMLCLLGLIWFRAWGWWAFLLIPILRQGRRLRAAPLLAPEIPYRERPLLFRLDPLDYVTLSFIFLIATAMWMTCGKLVTFAPDGYYHLLAARRIAEDGLVFRENWLDYIRIGIVPRWDWWQYAPGGRPHLYPPFFHVLIAVFSLPFHKNVEAGMQVLQAVTPPLVLFSTWYLARWLFDAPRGLLAVLLVGMNMVFAMLTVFALPSILANAMLPFLLVQFLRRRLISSSLLMGLMFWTHLGVGPLALLGLLLFSLRRREYLGLFVAVAGLGVLIALPWYVHIWAHLDWLGNPMAVQGGEGAWAQIVVLYMKLKWLLMLDLLIVLLVIRAWRMIPWFETRYVALSSMLLGFIPMLLEYGGRFFVHTLQLWAIIAVVPLVRFLSPPVRVHRVALFFALALLCPTLILAGQDKSMILRINPMPSGWILMSTVIAHGNMSFGGSGDDNNMLHRDAVAVGKQIRESTDPGQIIHVVGMGEYQHTASLAVTLGYHADRRIDTAAWPEVRPIDPQQGQDVLSDPTGCYVSKDPKALPEGLEVTEVAGFFVAVRRPEHGG